MADGFRATDTSSLHIELPALERHGKRIAQLGPRRISKIDLKDRACVGHGAGNEGRTSCGDVGTISGNAGRRDAIHAGGSVQKNESANDAQWTSECV